MKHSFIDRYSDLDSPVHRIDSRVKLLLVFLAIITVVSEPQARLFPFAFYGGLILVLILMSRLPLVFVLKRFMLLSPFILLAALFYPVSLLISKEAQLASIRDEPFRVALSIFCKAGLSILLLIWLISTEKFHNLLIGMRKLRMPRLIGIISALMYRYIFIFGDEALKTTRARESRTPGKLKMNKVKVYSNQMAMIFLRSWERSVMIYQSMLSRGFSGELPAMQRMAINRNDMLFFVSFVLGLLAIRFFVDPLVTGF